MTGQVKKYKQLNGTQKRRCIHALRYTKPMYYFLVARKGIECNGI